MTEEEMRKLSKIFAQELWAQLGRCMAIAMITIAIIFALLTLWETFT